MTSKEEYLKAVAEELHKPVKRKFKRLKVRFWNKDDTWCLDLVSMTNPAWLKANRGYKYILVCLDGFTRYCWAKALKDKTAESVYTAFADICSDAKRSPDKIWCDMGTEFKNAYFKKAGYNSEKNTMYHTYGESKSVLVERVNGTLKKKMWKVTAGKNTLDWVDELPGLLSWYNNKKHSTLGMSPAEASLDKNFDAIAKINDAGDYVLDSKRSGKFKVGDYVRISKAKGPFTRGFESQWSVETFKVKSVNIPLDLNDPITYTLEDYNGETIEGSFYENELQKAKFGDVYLVEKTLKTRTVKGKKEYFVSWVGYPSSYNSWISDKDVAFDFKDKKKS